MSKTKQQTFLRAPYSEVRHRMNPGDVLAFAGRGPVSRLISEKTDSPITHVAVIIQTSVRFNGKPQAGVMNQMIESTTLDGKSGVVISRISDRLRKYNGDVYWLPLSRDSRIRFDGKAFHDFLLRSEHRPYDTPGVVRIWLRQVPLMGTLLFSAMAPRHSLQSLFCSELVAEALYRASVIPDDMHDPNETTPADLIQYGIYRPETYIIAGNPDPVDYPVVNSWDVPEPEKQQVEIIFDPEQKEEVA
jgi:hypothetical protein